MLFSFSSSVNFLLDPQIPEYNLQSCRIRLNQAYLTSYNPEG